MQIGHLSKDQVINCLDDICGIVRLNVYKTDEVTGNLCEMGKSNNFSSNNYLEIVNSDYGINRLDVVFGCSPSPYTNIVAMVQNACQRENISYPSWFERKYSSQNQKRKPSRLSERIAKKLCK
jgi:hypothetical protein